MVILAIWMGSFSCGKMSTNEWRGIHYAGERPASYFIRPGEFHSGPKFECE